MRILAVTHQFPTVYQPTLPRTTGSSGRSSLAHMMCTSFGLCPGRSPGSSAAAECGRAPDPCRPRSEVRRYRSVIRCSAFRRSGAVISTDIGLNGVHTSRRRTRGRDVATRRTADVLGASRRWATAKLAKPSACRSCSGRTRFRCPVQATGKRRAYVSESVKAMTAVAAVSADLARHVVELGPIRACVRRSRRAVV